VVITAAELPDDIGEVQEIYRELSQVIGCACQPERTHVKQHPTWSASQTTAFHRLPNTVLPVIRIPRSKIACDIDQRVAMTVLEKAIDWPGVDIEIVPIRDYPTGSLTASITWLSRSYFSCQRGVLYSQGLCP
jgi:penicillin-binding protein 2